MKFLTDEKLVIVGAAGMIGSNMLQSALMMNLTPNICAYDSYSPGLEGTVEEMYHCAFPGVNITFTSDVEEAFTGASYIVSSGGAARKAGMTREDLLKGNTEIAAELGRDIRTYCPDVKHVTIIFNPADVTGLVTLIHSGIEPSRLTTLAALDSTRLQSALAKHFNVKQCEVVGARTYGGHGETMAVFASPATIQGEPLISLIGTDRCSVDQWHDLQQSVRQGGKRIIDLRGRSSFQSPSYLSVQMIEAAMGGTLFDLPAGVYLNDDRFQHLIMAMETIIDKDGVRYSYVKGTEEELEALEQSAAHLRGLIDEVIEMGIIPQRDQWHTLNPHLG